MSDSLRAIRSSRGDNPEAVKQRAYIAKRRAWYRGCDWPWPRVPEDTAPPPGTIDAPETIQE
jgi:hypothetical protein